jgi:hypothetical protein
MNKRFDCTIVATRRETEGVRYRVEYSDSIREWVSLKDTLFRVCSPLQNENGVSLSFESRRDDYK